MGAVVEVVEGVVDVVELPVDVEVVAPEVELELSVPVVVVDVGDEGDVDVDDCEVSGVVVVVAGAVDESGLEYGAAESGAPDESVGAGESGATVTGSLLLVASAGAESAAGAVSTVEGSGAGPEPPAEGSAAGVSEAAVGPESAELAFESAGAGVVAAGAAGVVAGGSTPKFGGSEPTLLSTVGAAAEAGSGVCVPVKAFREVAAGLTAAP